MEEGGISALEEKYPWAREEIRRGVKWFLEVIAPPRERERLKARLSQLDPDLLWGVISHVSRVKKAGLTRELARDLIWAIDIANTLVRDLKEAGCSVEVEVTEDARLKVNAFCYNADPEKVGKAVDLFTSLMRGSGNSKIVLDIDTGLGRLRIEPSVTPKLTYTDEFRRQTLETWTQIGMRAESATEVAMLEGADVRALKHITELALEHVPPVEIVRRVEKRLEEEEKFFIPEHL